MSLLEFSSLVFGYTDERIIASASGALQPGEVVGLVGANGCGKTTLIRLLMKLERPEGGNIQLNRAVGVPAYVSQAESGDDEAVLFDFVKSGRTELSEISHKLDELKTRHPTEAILKEIGELESRFDALDGHQWDNDTEKLLTGLSFDRSQFNQRLAVLSGGQRQKACIARALSGQARLLIFDEPTNHLDLEAQDYFVTRIRSLGADRGVLLVSHDRWLLDAVCTQTWELENGVLYTYRGNYSAGTQQRRLRRDRMRQEYEKQQELIAKTEEYIRRNIAGQNTRQARGRRKHLNRMERLEEPSKDPQISFALTPALTPGTQLLIVENLWFAYGYGSEAAARESFHRPGSGGLDLNPPMKSESGSHQDESIVRSVEFTVYRGERVGIIGPNGCGKSTLLRLLSRQLVPGRGMVAWGTNADLGIFHQDSAELTGELDLIGELRMVDPGITDSDARDYLARFGFSGDDVFALSRSLSGGERSRLSLARIFRRRPNVLVFDEPTNHLDIYAREALEQLLLNYQGSLIMVTHDRALLEKICNRLIIFEAAGDAGWSQQYFSGSYDDFLKWKSSGYAADPVADQGSADMFFTGVDPDQPRTFTPEYLETLAREARTSTAGYCEKQISRLGGRATAVEERIADTEIQIDRLEAEQREADLAREYGRLENLQSEIETRRELIDELFAELERIDIERNVWLNHLQLASASNE